MERRPDDRHREHLGVIDIDSTGYDVPPQSECATCHEGAKDGVLGFEAVGLSAPGATGLTMAELERLGWLRTPPHEPLVVPGTQAQSAALGWLHANCGNACHNRTTGALAHGTGLFMRLTSEAMQTVEGSDVYLTAVNVPSGFQPIPGESFLRVAPGDVAHSAIPYRAGRRDSSSVSGVQMPPIGTHVVDAQGVATLRLDRVDVGRERTAVAPRRHRGGEDRPGDRIPRGMRLLPRSLSATLFLAMTALVACSASSTSAPAPANEGTPDPFNGEPNGGEPKDAAGAPDAGAPGRPDGATSNDATSPVPDGSTKSPDLLLCWTRASFLARSGGRGPDAGSQTYQGQVTDTSYTTSITGQATYDGRSAFVSTSTFSTTTSTMYLDPEGTDDTRRAQHRHGAVAAPHEGARARRRVVDVLVLGHEGGDLASSRPHHGRGWKLSGLLANRLHRGGDVPAGRRQLLDSLPRRRGRCSPRCPLYGVLGSLRAHGEELLIARQAGPAPRSPVTERVAECGVGERAFRIPLKPCLD